MHDNCSEDVTDSKVYTIDDLKTIHKRVSRRYNMYVMGFLTSIALSLISISLFNPYLGLTGLFLFFSFFFHVNLQNACEGKDQLKHMLGTADLQIKGLIDKIQAVEKKTHGQYI